MDEKYTFLKDLDKEKVITAIKLQIPIEITTYSLPREMEMYIHEVLSLFLSTCHQEHMDQYLNFCLGELLSNSKKANTKRIYFEEKNLNINSHEDYVLGMKTFKEDTMANLSYYLTQQKKAGLYIKIVLQLLNNEIKIQIKNNVILCDDEKNRIQNKLDSVKQYNNPEDVYRDVLDQTEGAGLGIIIIVLMLQKIGLSKENFKVYSTDTETITSIVLPLNEAIQSEVSKLYTDFSKKQKTIPVFENTYKELNNLLSQENVSNSKVLELISKDVSLAALLVKKASESDRNCCNLEMAFNELGIEKIKELYSDTNSSLMFVNNDVDVEKLWEHSYKVAYFAYNLVQNIDICKNFNPHDIYLIALFHDIERILIEVVAEKNRENFENYYKDLGFSESILSMFFNNNWHSIGGHLLLQNWGFNSNISDVIKYYKSPLDAPDSLKGVCALVYISDIMQYYDENKIEYYQLDKQILEFVGIESESQLKFIVEKIKQSM